MALHLVGETIDAATAHQRTRRGELIAIVRGVYADAHDNVDALLRDHAIRIVRYLYPSAYLCAASATALAPTADDRLYIAGRRNHRTRLRGLELVQTVAPSQPSLDRAIVGDDLGEFSISISSPEQQLLEAFRLRSEQASSLTPELRRSIADRLVEHYGSPQAAADALWILARANDWFREGEGAERYLRSAVSSLPPGGNRAAFRLDVAWHGHVIGALSHDGIEWRWRAEPDARPPLIREAVPGALPPFIESLLPEGWLAKVLKDEDQRDMLRNGKRYLSNITIAAGRAELARLPSDRLHGRLARFVSHDRLFTGTYLGPARGALEAGFERNLARLFQAATTPRLSGVQIKAPMFLDEDGKLYPAVDRPFTHILKPAGTSGFEALPVVEWYCLRLADYFGLEVPAVALVDMPDGMPPALLVERFDIREDVDDARRIALEDFCSVLGLAATDKYKGTIEQVARALRPISTQPDADMETLFKRALFAWLIADGDMHLKNLAILKVAEPEARDFSSVRLAPVYDALTTRVFPGLEHDRMALKLAGKDERLRRKDFETLGRTIGLARTRSEILVREARMWFEYGVRGIRLPATINDADRWHLVIQSVSEVITSRIAGF